MSVGIRKRFVSNRSDPVFMNSGDSSNRGSSTSGQGDSNTGRNHNRIEHGENMNEEAEHREGRSA